MTLLLTVAKISYLPMRTLTSTLQATSFPFMELATVCSMTLQQSYSEVMACRDRPLSAHLARSQGVIYVCLDLYGLGSSQKISFISSPQYLRPRLSQRLQMMRMELSANIFVLAPEAGNCNHTTAQRSSKNMKLNI